MNPKAMTALVPGQDGEEFAALAGAWSPWPASGAPSEPDPGGANGIAVRTPSLPM